MAKRPGSRVPAANTVSQMTDQGEGQQPERGVPVQLDLESNGGPVPGDERHEEEDGSEKHEVNEHPVEQGSRFHPMGADQRHRPRDPGHEPHPVGGPARGWDSGPGSEDHEHARQAQHDRREAATGDRFPQNEASEQRAPHGRQIEEQDDARDLSAHDAFAESRREEHGERKEEADRRDE
jgi:hypothetical protein